MIELDQLEFNLGMSKTMLVFLQCWRFQLQQNVDFLMHSLQSYSTQPPHESTSAAWVGWSNHDNQSWQPPHSASFEPWAEFFMDWDEKLSGQEWLGWEGMGWDSWWAIGPLFSCSGTHEACSYFHVQPPKQSPGVKHEGKESICERCSGSGLVAGVGGRRINSIQGQELFGARAIHEG